MIIQKQKYIHDPANKLWGDCFRTCVASLVGLPRDSVPHVFDNGRNGDEGKKLLNEFLAPLGLRWAEVAVNGELSTIINGMAFWNTDLPFMLVGKSKNGVAHCVIVRDGKIVMDPSLDNSGIVGPTDDNCYWLGFPVKRTD